MKEMIRSAAVIMAIGIDKQRNCERILIGEEYQVRSAIKGETNASLLYDTERELGSFVAEHQGQMAGDWNAGAIWPLKQALKSPFERKAQEAAAWEFLAEKEKTHDPISLFAAHMCRHWYLEEVTSRRLTKDVDSFEEKAMCLTKSFRQDLLEGKRYYLMDKLLAKAQDSVYLTGSDRDTDARIWYSCRNRYMEFVIVSDSFYPALLYYLTRLQEMKYCFCKCSICGRMFIASSGHYSLCSDPCRVSQNLQNKREYEARARKDRHNADCKNTTQRMRNRINRLRRENAPEELLTRVGEAFESFKAEAIVWKKKIKTEADSKRFINWLFEQEQLIDELCEM